jgi:peptide subunit release factor 1 (eRF1)
MNKEYYQAKADFCRNLAVKQMVEGDSREAGANLIRMVNALSMLNIIEQKEEKVKVECVTCGKEKDYFSKEFEYNECAQCSIKDYYKEEKDKCKECGFYTWDADSAPLENCKTCGRERIEV